MGRIKFLINSRLARWFISNQKYPTDLVQFWRDLHRLENVDISYGHLENFTDIWNILGPFGTFYVHLVHFVFIWYI
jgi:hypothetical protein